MTAKLLTSVFEYKGRAQLGLAADRCLCRATR
jgi:hypothetical protein